MDLAKEFFFIKTIETKNVYTPLIRMVYIKSSIVLETF